MLSPAGTRLAGLRLGPARQLPVWPNEVAGVAVWEAFEVVLMIRLGFPEGTGGSDFRHYFARPQAGGVDIGNGVVSDAFLFIARVIDGRAIAAAHVIALPVARGRIVDLEEEFEQRPIACDLRVEGDLYRLRMSPVIVVGGIRNIAAGRSCMPQKQPPARTARSYCIAISTPFD
jgi:hypothetical protein